MTSRSLGRSTPLYRFPIAVLALVLLSQFARAQWQASVGAQSKDLGTQALAFLPNKLWIHAGDSITWTVVTDEPHTITFLLHAVLNSTSDSAHSGFIVADPQDRIGLAQVPIGVTRFRITFNSTGVYPYICALHDGLGMKGKVIVLH